MAIIEHRPLSASATAVDNTTVYFIPHGEMLSLIERSPGSALSLLQEISHRLREFNQQYLYEVVQAERLSAVGPLARSIVRDLKHPLQIIGLTSMMAGSPDAPVEMRAQARERICRQVDRINELIAQILDFTQGSTTAIQPVSTEQAACVRRLLEEMRQEIELKLARLEFAALPPAVKLRLEPKRLRRVFANLLHNATDAMPGGGRIIFRVSLNAKEVVTEIEDTGPGVAPGDRRPAFSSLRCPRHWP